MSSYVRTRPRKTLVKVEVWNRKLHFYLGLYFLFFLWLFSLTGLLLNHGQWAIGQAANVRRETRYEQAIQTPIGDTDSARARDLMRQLNMVGEIDWPASQPLRHLDFNVSRPRDANQVRVDLDGKRASIQHFDNSGLATFRIFHTFSGSRFNAATTERDWMVTTVWVVAMDALSAGLIVMVLSSYYMWYRLEAKRRLGIIALAAGMVSCAAFFVGFL
jgi:hypothetical protein